jgi:hypothetical protein
MLFSFIVDQQTVAAQADKVTFVPYRNPIFGIEVEYPSDWGRLDLSFLQNNSVDLNFYPLDDASGAEQVKIQIENLPSSPKMTLEEYNDIKISSVEGQILESNSTILANLPAHEIVFTNLVLKQMQVWALKDDRVYTITYVTEEEDFLNDLQTARRMIESFKITE